MQFTCISFLLIIGTGLVLGTVELAPEDILATEVVTGSEMMTDTMAVTTAMMTGVMTTAATTPMTTPSQETLFRVDDHMGNACFLENIKASFKLKYNMTNAANKTVESSITFELPQTSTVDTNSSMCGMNDTEMTLVFGDPSEGNKFVQVFSLSTNHSALTNISLFLKHTEVLFPNSTQAGKLVEYSATVPSATFMVGDGSAFVCRSQEMFQLSKKSTVTFSDVKVQTADIVNSTFGKGAVCPQDTPTSSPMPTTTGMTPTTPLPPANEWIVKDSNNKTCMIFNMSMEFRISYDTTKKTQNVSTVPLPKDASSADSVCGNKTAKFVLSFDGWKLEMDFFLDNTTKKYNNTAVRLFYVYDKMHFPDAKLQGQNETVVSKTAKIEAPQNKSYTCNSESTFKAGDNVTIVLAEVHMQPFAYLSNGTLGDPAPCAADQKFNNIVPIAVGCALAGLVIIVLIAYLIGRQRSQKTGYESV